MKHISETLNKIQAGEPFSPAELKRQMDRNRRQESVERQTELRHVYGLSPEEAAIHLDRKCPHCGEYLTPWKGPDDWRGGEKWYWPDSHNCEAEKKAKERQETQQVMDQQTLEQREYCKRLQDAGLIGRLAEATFASFSARDDWAEAEEVWRRVMTYAKTVEGESCEKPFLILYGEVGTGKSHLAASVVHLFLDKGHRPCYFRVWPDYLKRLQASWRQRRSDESDEEWEGRETEEDIINELQLGKVAVIDDLTTRRPTDWVRETLYPIMNHRYNAKLPTVLTLNYGPGDVDPVAPGRLALEGYLGRAVLDRVIGAAFDVIEFSGPSYRSGLNYEEVTG